MRWAWWYAAGSVLAVLAWVVVGDAWWLQPVNLATFWWSLPAVLLVIVAVTLGRRGAALALAVPAVLWLWSYGSLFLPSTSSSVAPDVRVATFNTYVAIDGIDHVLGLVAATRPDVLVLQEVFPPREAALSAALADDYPHQRAVQSPGVGGVMVASRFPVSNTTPVDEATAASRTTEVVRLDVDGQPLQIVPVHLLSPCPTCGTSLTSRLATEGDTRQAEIGAILRALSPGVPAIVAGDFNSNERSGPYRALTGAGFADPHREAGRGPGFTWPDDGAVPALLRIDWVMTRGLTAVDAWVGQGRGSDHRPVVVDLAFDEEVARGRS
jgi:vancomycin resistance protein VanJ